MLDWLVSVDEALFLTINGWHQAWLDQPMFWISKTWPWVGLYAFLAFRLYKQSPESCVYALVAVAILIGLCDQTASGLFKPLVERLRPTHTESLADWVHTVNGYRGGRYGFFSSHAANSFGLAVFLVFRLKMALSWRLLLIFWAFLVSYSRIYLGVHYPLDIICGALCGCLWAFFIHFFLYEWLLKVGKRIRQKKGTH